MRNDSGVEIVTDRAEGEFFSVVHPVHVFGRRHLAADLPHELPKGQRQLVLENLRPR